MGIELLAPAGDFDCLKAAVSAGADAVYLGASKYSARQSAKNFDKDELSRAVSYAHIRGVKVYLAINTLMLDSELEDALTTCAQAYEAGIDAFIVQDVGLIKLISENFDVPVHASTQMTVFDEKGLMYLKSLGIKRAVLARECSKEEIMKMAKESDMELEVFCHGAICMSYSGQCLMSSMLGGRSANRGACAQPCRLPYEIGKKKGYFLSPKDLSLLDEVNDLIKMGVSSLKIEGRMKGPAYVAAAVKAFRNAIDNGIADEKDKENLLKAFSRGGDFTLGCYGKVKGKEMMKVDSSNDDVLKTADREFTKSLEMYWGEKEIKKIPVSANLLVGDEWTEFTLCDEEGNKASAKVLTDKEERGNVLTEEYAKAQLSKLGATPFVLSDFTSEIKVNAYFGASGLNALRRSAVEELMKMREGKRAPRNFSIKEEKKGGFPGDEIIISVTRKEQAKALNEAGTKRVFVPFEVDKNADYIVIDRVYKNLPENLSATEILAGSLGAAEYAKKHSEKVIADYSMNITNRKTAALFDEVVSSVEVPLSRVLKIAETTKTYVFGYGYLPLMTTKNCVIKVSGNCDGKACDNCNRKITLKDRKNVEFLVKSNGNTNTIYNSVPIFMADRLAEIKKSGAFGVILKFSEETPEECVKIYKMFRDGKGITPPDKFTRAHFYK